MHQAAIVILNYNGKAWLEKFLPLVIANSKYPIIVADNGSSDDSLNFLSTFFPSIIQFKIETNRGYAGGYNQVLSEIDVEYFVLLNSDVEVTPNWDSVIIEIMAHDKSIAACQPKIKNYNNRTHFEFAGAAGGFIDTFGYPYCRGRIFDTLEEDLGQYNDNIEIFWATGACLFLRKSAFLQAGKFDEDFFAHMEEIDLCWRLKGLGYKIMYCGQSEVFHVGGGTLQNGSYQKFYLNFRNSLWMLYKNLPSNELFIKLLMRLFLDGIASIRFLIQGKPIFIWIVLKSHLVFYSSILKFYKKRKEVWSKRTNNKMIGMNSISIVLEYFIRKKTSFKQL